MEDMVFYVADFFAAFTGSKVSADSSTGGFSGGSGSTGGFGGGGASGSW